MSLRKPPKNIGLLYDWHAQQRHQTVVHVDRPMDIAPDLGTAFDANQLATLVADTSAWLAAAGASYGSRVGIVKDNHLDMQILAAATARIEWASRRRSPLSTAPMTSSSCSGSWTRPSSSSPPMCSRTFSRVEDYPLAHVPHVVLGIAAVDTTNIKTFQLTDLAGASVPPANIRPDGSPMMVTHTSGTTNTPKLVVHTANTNRAGTRSSFLPIPGGVSRHSTPC